MISSWAGEDFPAWSVLGSGKEAEVNLEKKKCNLERFLPRAGPSHGHWARGLPSPVTVTGCMLPVPVARRLLKPLIPNVFIPGQWLLFLPCQSPTWRKRPVQATCGALCSPQG